MPQSPDAHPSTAENRPPAPDQSPAGTETLEKPTKRPREKPTTNGPTNKEFPNVPSLVPIPTVSKDRDHKDKKSDKSSSQAIRETDDLRINSLVLESRSHDGRETKSDNKPASTKKKQFPVANASHIDAAFESRMNGSKSKKLQEARRPGRR